MEGQGRAVPEQSMSVLEVNGVQLTEESSLNQLRKACKHLRISPRGSKAILFGRIQSEMADMKTKAAVQVADSIVEAFKRVPEIEAHHGKPHSAEEIALHEVTHFPRMPWCSACVATRSREDAHSKKPSEPVGRLHVDFMFCKTENPNEDDHPLMTFLVAVESTPTTWFAFQSNPRLQQTLDLLWRKSQSLQRSLDIKTSVSVVIQSHQ